MLDVRGALDSLPALPLQGEQGEGEAVRATGTDGAAARTVAPVVAPTPDNLSATQSLAGKPAGAGLPNTPAVSGSADKEKGPLSIPDSGPSCRGDWIRTSDLLNPIQAAGPGGREEKPQKSRHFQRAVTSTLPTVLYGLRPFSTAFSAISASEGRRPEKTVRARWRMTQRRGGPLPRRAA